MPTSWLLAQPILTDFHYSEADGPKYFIFAKTKIANNVPIVACCIQAIVIPKLLLSLVRNVF